ncbi:MAG: dehydrogenase [Alphaproteobacteria bacterium]|nr:MAG: dehydrogenase [Alphaproteobacteria bacterium]
MGAALFACASAPVAGAATIERVGPRLAHPWGMDFIGTDQVLVTVRGGGLQRVNLADGSAADITGLPKVFARRQGGMLDVTVDGPHVYLCYSADLGGKSSTAIDRARLEGDALVERETIFTGNNPARSGHHFGCRLQMAGGYLFASIGDRGDRDNAQDPAAHAGSILRLNPDGTVPDDNPHAAGQADGWAPELYSIGHRNPQGMAVHPQTGEIWAHEHGPRGGDEINIPQKGGNHGWPTVSHGREYATGRRVSKHDSLPGYVDPVWVWDPSIAPSGMAFYPAGNTGEGNGRKHCRVHVPALSGASSGGVAEIPAALSGDARRGRAARIRAGHPRRADRPHPRCGGGARRPARRRHPAAERRGAGRAVHVAAVGGGAI